MKQKTKIEIIKETADYYSADPINRISRDGISESCRYLTIDGKKCAVGRCFSDDIDKDIITKLEGYSVYNIEIIKEEYFKEEYRGHDRAFWQNLQNFHDNYNNWNETGLTKKGEYQLNGLLEEYKDN